MGDFVIAMEYGRELVHVANEIGFVSGRMGSHLYFGMICNRKEDFPRSLTLLERAYELMEMASLQLGTGFNGVTGSLGTAYLRAGRVTEAIDLLEKCRAQSLVQGAISDLFIGAPALAEAYLTVGRHDEALEVAQEAVGLAREQGKRGFLGWQLHALAEVYTRRDPPDLEAAVQQYREALTVAETLGMRPLEARCRLGLGTVYGQIGRRGEAREELDRAVSMLRGMEMTFWMPEAEAALAALLPSPESGSSG